MITSMNHITLAITNLERSFAFYRDILGLTPLVKWDKGAYFLIGEQANGFWFCLNVDPKHSATIGYTHYAFSVEQNNFTLYTERILKSGVKIFKNNTSPGDSLYFLDPDGHKLEIHTGNWCARIAAKKTNTGNWKDVEWYV